MLSTECQRRLTAVPEPDHATGLPPAGIFFGRGEAMAAVRRTLEAVSATEVPVLIQGESGTGKEVCARWLHRLAARRGGPLVKVSCPAIPQGLIETELFGYEKGAFTGAHTTRRGRVEQADGGTLLLDEVGSLDLGMQAKLLQLLQDGSFLRVGGHETHTIRTRLISIANRDLQGQVREGTLRLDLLYRINAIALHLPSLRHRREDLPELIDYFLEQHTRVFRTNPAPLSRHALGVMHRYAWPGNIRQLDNVVRSYALIGGEEALVDTLLSEASDPPGQSSDLIDTLDLSRPVALKQITRRATHELERQIIVKVLKANGWSRLKTARWLGISYRSLLSKLNGTAEQPASAVSSPLRSADSVKRLAIIDRVPRRS